MTGSIVALLVESKVYERASMRLIELVNHIFFQVRFLILNFAISVINTKVDYGNITSKIMLYS